jgi:hypothetical protein
MNAHGGSGVRLNTFFCPGTLLSPASFLCVVTGVSSSSSSSSSSAAAVAEVATAETEAETEATVAVTAALSSNT